jgi:hypothetical protein
MSRQKALREKGKPVAARKASVGVGPLKLHDVALAAGVTIATASRSLKFAQ